MTDSPSDKALQEFLSEAQEIVESFNRDLLALDAGRNGDRHDPDLVNGIFRAVHSLKGLSGLFGVARMTTLSHHLENLLDSLRLGRVTLTPATLDFLFEAVALFNRIISETAADGGSAEQVSPEEQAVVDEFVARLDVLANERSGAPAEAPQFGGYQLEPSLLSVLTEYEEHRLRENIRLGRMLYRVHCGFELMSIDRGLDDLKAHLKPLGEVITYLPSAESASELHIELDVILGSTRHIHEVKEALGERCVVTELPRRSQGQSVSVPTSAAESVNEPLFSPATSDGTAAPTAPTPAPAPPTIIDDTSELSLKSVAQTVRVDIRKLDHLMNIVGELTLSRAGFQSIIDVLRADRSMAKLTRALQRESRTLGRRLDELQAGILEVRMVPLGQIFDKLSRVVRKLSRDAGKEIRLTIAGADTELDKLIVEELSDPLMHIIRNCIDHGIEPMAARAKLGKPEQGTIRIAAEQRGNHVVIAIEDDGGGVDANRIVKKAVERGLVDAAHAAEMSEREALNLMFLPGVSTKDVPDELSGRGVGMDVVKTNIARLSGIIDVDSEADRGTRMTITLPITLAIIQALVVRSMGRTFAIPLNSVLESLLITPQDVMTIERREVLNLRGQTLPLARLGRLFELDGYDRAAAGERQFVVVVGLAQHRLGLCVDELLGQQDIVIKPLGKSLGGVAGIAGATELGGQKTVLVLDVAAIVEEAVQMRGEAA